jgi:hypothetical protein
LTLDKVFAECPKKAFGKEPFADEIFVECSLSIVTLGKGFAECKIAFAECLRYSAKNAIPVVNRWLPVFWTVQLVWSDGLRRDRMVRYYTRTSGHARHGLRALWRALRDSGLSGIRARKVRWRAERSDIMRGRPCSELIHYIVKMTIAVVLDTSSFAYRNMARTEKTYLLPMCLSRLFWWPIHMTKNQACEIFLMHASFSLYRPS